MQINWFPGHMTKALRLIEENIKLVDIVCYVLDARAPLACLNPSINTILADKPIVYILNKSDLADSNKVNLWVKHFVSSRFYAVALDATKSSSSKLLLNELNKIKLLRIDKFKNKGVNTSVRVMIVGIPNSGKSTIINMLCGRKSAMTGDKPGVTKGKQWVKLANAMDLLDTPGTLWSSIDSQRLARHLAFIGSIKDDILDITDLAVYLVEELLIQYPQAISTRYNIFTDSVKPIEIIDAICVKRGFVIKGGEYDRERCSKALLDDLRKGKLGRITFEIPEAANE